MKIAIIGAGAVGTALSRCFRVPVGLWDKRPEASAGSSPEAVLGGAGAVVLCVPSPSLREAAETVARHAPPEATVYSVTKGVERVSGKFAHVVLADVFGAGRSALLSGPMLAGEVEAGSVGAGVVAGSGAAYDLLLRGADSGKLALEWSSDAAGVAACGVLKNIYALLVGASFGAGYGQNVAGWLIGRAVREMAGLLPHFGGRAETALGTAGLADLVATCASEDSLNRRAGGALARGQEPPVSEATVSLEPLLGRLAAAPPPLLAAVKAIALDRAGARAAVAGLLASGRR